LQALHDGAEATVSCVVATETEIEGGTVPQGVQRQEFDGEVEDRREVVGVAAVDQALPQVAVVRCTVQTATDRRSGVDAEAPAEATMRCTSGISSDASVSRTSVANSGRTRFSSIA
jgi:hypothetical protein